MKAKKYYFYISNPQLQQILDELKKQRIFPEVIQAVLNNGLEREIERRKKALEKLSEVYKGTKKE